VIEVQVEAVLIDNATNSPVMLLREVKGDRVLPVFIGTAEASTIAYALEGIQYVRPLTVDLMRNLIVGMNGKVGRVLITKLENDTFYAELVIETGDRLIAIDARPSDAVGLALRTGAPIYVENAVMESAGQFLSPEDEDKLRSLRTRLRGIDPEEPGNFPL
jgi:bifunctional DNase/RNase